MCGRNRGQVVPAALAAYLLAAEQQLRPFALALFEISLHLFHMRLFNHRPHLYGGVERVTGL